MGNDGRSTMVIDPVAAEAEVEQRPGTPPEVVPPAGEEPSPAPKEKPIFAGIYEAKNVRDVIPGVVSELGPTDPQVGNYPALGLGSAINYIAGLCKQYPDAKEMLA